MFAHSSLHLAYKFCQLRCLRSSLSSVCSTRTKNYKRSCVGRFIFDYETPVSLVFRPIAVLGERQQTTGYLHTWVDRIQHINARAHRSAISHHSHNIINISFIIAQTPCSMSALYTSIPVNTITGSNGLPIATSSI